ncbi:carbon-nitrogen family hydrolase [Mesorhizobium sp. VK23B]|uniref:Carbon-nitrogen family hydrolase n=1 Tax=Mesorhizobium dulcispinae TaxID=3072316 RepID=A0ABU4X883_9HYPH|nr:MULTISPECIES: carbon-nitrogen family hydrolase [unclassified Mesorhizobium]MDX8464624.1 carbon-nitrogen family hydrolase [Mesorhizobium sp. VK23B]MDX8471010.1 carbon-nitrogen family hydrolase [Mesorhizobium sp. VK23A]
MEISLVQLASPDDETVVQRIERVAGVLREQRGADLVVLPELWSAGYFAFDRYAERAEALDGPTVSMCAAAAREIGAFVHVGSIVERTPDGALRNTSVILDTEGRIVHTYSKLHVFRYQSLEAELLTPGEALPVASTPFGHVAGTTCYDLRFPGLWSELSARGAELVVVPAAWPAARREHWRLFTSARAVEHQLFVIACNAAGIQGGVLLGGTSRIVDPFGELLGEAGPGPEILHATIDPGRVARVREEFPVIADRLEDYTGLAG